MAIVKQKDKRSGITYVYESKSVWDKDKKQSRSTRRLIGRLNEKTGEIIETDGRRRGGRALGETPVPVKAATPKIRKPLATAMAERKFCGATYLFDAIGNKLGLTADLKSCFPSTYKMILSVAYYLILEDSSPLFRFSKWAMLHTHPYGADIPSQRSSELFSCITEDAKMKFFRLQGRRRSEGEYLAYDTTSISSYSEELSLVKYGKNKDHDPLRQFNLLLVFGEKSYLPFYYRRLAGNIPDVKTVKVYLKELDVMGYAKAKIVGDRGLYSVENVNALYKSHIKFVIGAKTGLSFVKEVIERESGNMRDWNHYNESYDLYTHSETIKWDYTQERPYKCDVLKDDRRMYLHLYYNPAKALEDETNFNRMILSLRDELQSGRRIQGHEKQYAKYFDVRKIPVRGIQVSVKQKASDEAKKLYGYFVLLSNDIKDSVEALQIYRTRDVVEKAFGNIKERLNGRRMLVSSDSSLEGKLFVQFVALIYLSYIRKQGQALVKAEAGNQKETMQAKDIIKDPYVLEFLDLKPNTDFYEKELEQAIIDKLQEFLLELGRGFSFVGRQFRITLEGEHFYIDLVFYNYILKCFLLIDLKTGKLTHQDIGQLDTYVRFFEDKIKQESDNPTIGLILCSEKNNAIVKYSLLNDSKQIFASKYKMYLPTEQELKKEIERERQQIEQEKKLS